MRRVINSLAINRPIDISRYFFIRIFFFFFTITPRISRRFQTRKLRAATAPDHYTVIIVNIRSKTQYDDALRLFSPSRRRCPRHVPPFNFFHQYSFSLCAPRAFFFFLRPLDSANFRDPPQGEAAKVRLTAQEKRTIRINNRNFRISRGGGRGRITKVG